jgi:hypothetical protein
MKFTNRLDQAIMYSLNQDKYRELKPNEFVFLPHTCTELHFKPDDINYTLSVRQLFNMPLGDVDHVVLSNNAKSVKEDNALVVTRQDWFLDFLYRNEAGMGEKIYTPKFDITIYDLEKQARMVVDVEKVTNKIKKMSTSNATQWWVIIVLIIIVLCIIVVGTIKCKVVD